MVIFLTQIFGNMKKGKKKTKFYVLWMKLLKLVIERHWGKNEKVIFIAEDNFTLG